MIAVEQDIINNYNKELSSAFKFDHDWYHLAYRCSGCHGGINRHYLALDVCSDLMMLAAGKLKHKILDITDINQMIKFFCKCAKLTALKLINVQSMFLPSVIRGRNKVTNSHDDNSVIKDIKSEQAIHHETTLNDLEFIITNNSNAASDLVTNKYKLAHYIVENFRDNFDFCYTSLAKDLGLSRSTVEAAMQVLRQEIMELDPSFAFINEKSRAERIRRKTELVNQRRQEQKRIEEEEKENYDPYNYMAEMADYELDCMRCGDYELE